jgi:hypothetical protein
MKYIKTYEEQYEPVKYNLKTRIKTRRPVEGLKYQVGDFVKFIDSHPKANPDNFYKIIEIDPIDKNLPYFIENIKNEYDVSWQLEEFIEIVPEEELIANKFNL